LAANPMASEREFGGIPEFHAVRTANGLYAEYITGEREFYRLDYDPSEVSNGATNDSASAPYFERINYLKTSGGRNLRQAESAR
jgi:hypothetical protein